MNILIPFRKQNNKQRERRTRPQLVAAEPNKRSPLHPRATGNSIVFFVVMLCFVWLLMHARNLS